MGALLDTVRMNTVWEGGFSCKELLLAGEKYLVRRASMFEDENNRQIASTLFQLTSRIWKKTNEKSFDDLRPSSLCEGNGKACGRK